MTVKKDERAVVKLPVDWSTIATGIVGAAVVGVFSLAWHTYSETVQLRNDLEVITEEVHTIYEIVDRAHPRIGLDPLKDGAGDAEDPPDHGDPP